MTEEKQNFPMYFEYLKEMHNIVSMETTEGFVQGRQLTMPKGKEKITGLEIRDIYVKPEHRGNRVAAKLVDLYIENFEKIGFKVNFLVGYINQTDPNKEASLLAQIRYGLKIQKIVDGKVILYKELKEVPPSK